LCGDCHEQQWAAEQLKQLDAERKLSWSKLYQAEAVLKNLRSDELIKPSAKNRPSYPGDSPDAFLQYQRIGFFEGQASAFYNVSPIERDYFEMWYFDNLKSYKGAAHGDVSFVDEGQAAMDDSLETIKQNAERLRSTGEQKLDKDAEGNIWLEGEYTEYNRDNN
jgi:hydroxylamine dehydrogenase